MAIVSSYMAHHQGMALVALGNVLHSRVMVERFHADRLVEAARACSRSGPGAQRPRYQNRADEVKGDEGRDLVPPMLQALPVASRRDPSHTPAVERSIRSDGDRGRVGLQQMGATSL